MVQEHSGMHHFHKRKRVHEKLEPFPHPNKWKNLLDRLVYLVGFLALILTVPQVTKIWFEQTAAGVSVIAWTGYFFAAVFWTIYGVVHKEKPLIIIFGGHVILNLLIVLGTLIYA